MSADPKTVDECLSHPPLQPALRHLLRRCMPSFNRCFWLGITIIGLVGFTPEGSQARSQQAPTSPVQSSSGSSLVDPGYLGPPATPVPLKPITAFVLGSRVNLRAQAGNEGRIVATLRIGTQVEVLAISQQQVRVRAGNGDEGWVSTELLTPELPTVQLCLERAATTQNAEQRVWLERARELAPWNLQVLTQLRDAYQKQRDPRAELLARTLDPTSPLMLTTCLQGQCRVWLELDQGRFSTPAPPGPDAAEKKRRLERVRAIEGWFPLENQRLAGWYTPARLENVREKSGGNQRKGEPPTSGARPKDELRRGVGVGFDDPLIADGELVSRVIQLLPPPTELPDKQFLQDQAVEWLGWRETGAEKDSGTPKTPQKIPQSLRIFHLWSSGHGTALVLELGYALREGHTIAGRRQYGVLFAWMDSEGRLTFTSATDGLRASSNTAPALRSTRVHAVLDLEGDGKPEVILTVAEEDSGTIEGLPAEMELWRGQEREHRGQFQPEVRAAWGE